MRNCHSLWPPFPLVNILITVPDVPLVHCSPQFYMMWKMSITLLDLSFFTSGFTVIYHLNKQNARNRVFCQHRLSHQLIPESTLLTAVITRGKEGHVAEQMPGMGFPPGRAGRLAVRPCKRTPLCAKGEDRARSWFISINPWERFWFPLWCQWV